MDFQLTLMTVSLLVLLSGLLVIKIQRLYLTGPMIAMLVGAVLSPALLDVVDMSQWEHAPRFMKLASMLTISMALMATAYKVPNQYVVTYKRTQTVILLLGMPLMLLCSGLIAYMVLGLPLAVAFLLGAVITPTDPVISSTIVSGKFAEKLLPASVRHTLSFESAANDGLAYPLVLLMLFFAGYGESEGIGGWLWRSVGWETLGAIALGVLMGYGFGRFMHLAHRRGWMNSTALLSFSVALGFFVLGLVQTLQANGIVAVFAAGLMVNHEVSKNESLREENVQEMIERLFTIPVFFFFGLFLPVEAWLKMGWPLLLFAVLILLFRRVPAFLALKPLLPRFQSWYDVLFLGWFGPIGIGALFYAMHVWQETPYRVVWEVSSFVIFFSTLFHGLTSIPFSRRYAAQAGT